MWKMAVLELWDWRYAKFVRFVFWPVEVPLKVPSRRVEICGRLQGGPRSATQSEVEAHVAQQ